MPAIDGNECTPLRPFASKIEVITASNNHVRYVPGALAKAMVDKGAAQVANVNGKVKSIRLVTSAATHARIIGPPGDGRARGVRFTKREMLDESGSRVWAHHGRATDYE